MTPDATLAEILFLCNVLPNGSSHNPCRLLMNFNIWIT